MERIQHLNTEFRTEVKKKRYRLNLGLSSRLRATNTNLFRLHFSPQFVIQRLIFISEEIKRLTVFQLINIRECNRAVSHVVILDQCLPGRVRDGVSDVFKIHFCNIRSTEEVDEFFCMFLILCIFWNAFILFLRIKNRKKF